jgi:outer membrane protein TolC
LFLSALEAERTLLTARSGYLAALESAALATIELERVTGRPAAALIEPTESDLTTTTQPASAPARMEVEQ